MICSFFMLRLHHFSIKNRSALNAAEHDVNFVKTTNGISMNLQREITNHLEWIDTIASLLGSEEMTEEALRVITQHNNCTLGHWLYSDASTKFKNLPEFEKLIESHDAFHRLAGSLITALQLGKEAEAIEVQTQFIEMSQKVINYIQILQEDNAKHNDEDNSDNT